ncbi:disintegrin and metalloproteinase domain-containing protein 9-like [Sphaeramia orbicularis]|uniref:disintegrin and metalloproteinase domain-containing protein 9-like n=1 Tax=Sphaeramia orbicularis TaxID=375764 RepID=UPI00118132D4|nr:disintegrin and metalloproteinase domain-containing protein 9-like [Sphaeramia orbicularis]
MSLSLALLELTCRTVSKDFLDGFSSIPSKYSVVNPQVIRGWSGSIDGNQFKDENEDETISYSLNIKDKKHYLHLKKNRDFLHPNFVQYSGGKSTFPKQHVHCYYHGEVEGYPDSLVALSTCSGLSGVIFLENETYGLEPMPKSTSNEHVLYLLEDVHSEPVTCGVVSEVNANATQTHTPFELGQSLMSLLQKKRNLPETSYVELALVVDNLRYVFRKQNETAVREEMVQMANLLDGYYKRLNIRVVLVGLEVFKESNPFSVDGSARAVLGRFVKWRKETLIPKLRHDIGQLIVGRPNVYAGGVVGIAFVGTVCSEATSGGINVFGNGNLNYASTVVAHEMGHNLGMQHDDGRCSCSGSCIMAAIVSGSTTFSTCSGDDFEKLIRGGGGVCLKNMPSQSDIVGIAKCGNGLLEEGEQCDCGTPQECTNKCCDAATCRFTAGSPCTNGSCCSDCQIKVAGTLCRSAINTCDLPEFCNGQSAFCPEDFYIMDGLTCENNTAYCYEGQCQTYDFQCRHLFAPDPATKAADACFQHANTKGNLFGNCGNTSNGLYIKCAAADAMCGKVQCTNVDVNNPPSGAHVSIQIINGSSCVNADFNLGVLDPAYVNPGSPCAEGKACIDFKCVDAAALLPNLNCDANTTCHRHGVCNNNGNCHCDDGWAPPSCDRPGRGGSVDSGPAMIGEVNE